MSKNRQTVQKIYNNHYTELNGNFCTYCGISSDTKDHVPPLTWTESYGVHLLVTEYSAPFIIVPCCSECNVHLGSRGLFTIRDRKEFIHRDLSTRYKKVLESPEWDEDEIEELSGRLKDSILNQKLLKEILKRRISFSKE